MADVRLHLKLIDYVCNMKSLKMMSIINLHTFLPDSVGPASPPFAVFEEGSSRTQPELACIGRLTNATHGGHVTVSRNDGVTIPLHDDNLTSAVDELFKFYWLCDVACPVPLASVFIFF